MPLQTAVIGAHNSTEHTKLISIPYIHLIRQNIDIQTRYPIYIQKYVQRSDINMYQYRSDLYYRYLSDRVKYRYRDWMKLCMNLELNCIPYIHPIGQNMSIEIGYLISIPRYMQRSDRHYLYHIQYTISLNSEYFLST